MRVQTILVSMAALGCLSSQAVADDCGRKLNFFSKDHCPGKVIYWKTNAYAMVPITLQLPTGDNSRTGFRVYSYRGSHINVPVTIDGTELKAALDTASPTSTMSTDTARY